MPIKSAYNEDLFTANEVMEVVVFIKEEMAGMATKDDLNELRNEFRNELTEKIATSEHRIMNYIDKTIGRIDMKLDTLVNIVGDKQIISPVEVGRIRAMGL